MAGIQITDKRIINILANSYKVTELTRPLLEQLKNLRPVVIQGLLNKKNPPQQTNYQSLYLQILGCWRSRAGEIGNRGATPTTLSNILRNDMELPGLAGQIEQDVLPLFTKNSDSKWWVPAAKLLAQNDGTASDRWTELVTAMGIQSDMPSLRLVKETDLRTFWLHTLIQFNEVNEMKFDKIMELQRALQAVGLMDESAQIQKIILEETEDVLDASMEIELC